MITPDFLNGGFIPLNPGVQTVLDSGKSPADWVEILAAKGITMSERSLRERANRLGFRIKLGRVMLITDKHMEAILKDGEQCRSRRIKEPGNGGPKVGSNTSTDPSPTTTSAARGHLQSKLRGTGAGTKRNGKYGSTSSDPKPKSNAR